MNEWKTFILTVAAMACATVMLGMKTITTDAWMNIVMMALGVYGGRTIADKAFGAKSKGGKK